MELDRVTPMLPVKLQVAPSLKTFGMGAHVADAPPMGVNAPETSLGPVPQPRPLIPQIPLVRYANQVHRL